MQKPIRRDARQTSCDECHRRKQRCTSKREDGPCDHCARRFPPVQCIGRPLDATRRNVHDSIRRGASDVDPRTRGRRSEDLHGATNRILQPPRQPEKNVLLTAANLPYGNPKSFGGILTAVNCADIPTVHPSPRNTELFHFYCQTLAPKMDTLDGNEMSPVIKTKILPWMMQSPLMPQLAIFTASTYLTVIRGHEVTKNPETIAIKGTLLSSINSYLKLDFDKIHEEAIQSVLHLALLEWNIGDSENLWAHMKGVKGMLKFRGGIKALQNSKLRQLLVLSDYMLSCSYERELYIVQPEDSSIIPNSVLYPESYSCPLFASDIKFQDIQHKLGLNSIIASILDDVRLITTTILSFSTGENSHTDFTPSEKSTIIQSIAFKIYNNLQLLSTPNSTDSCATEIIFETIHMSASIYTSAIASRIPFSLAYTPELRRKLYSNLRKADLTSWKKIPGTFLWVLFVACPGSGNDMLGRLLRRTSSLTSVFLGFRALGLSVSCLRNLYEVQRWIGEVDRHHVVDSSE